MSTQPEAEVGSLSPQRLSLEQASRLLTKVSGQQIGIAILQQDVATGAPTNADGTINLLHYAAWLVKGMSHDDV